MILRVLGCLLALGVSRLLAQTAAASATPAEQLQVAPGFKVELLKSATPGEGSWISMTIDAKGRLYISPQGAVPESAFKWAEGDVPRRSEGSEGRAGTAPSDPPRASLLRGKKSSWGGLVRVTLDDKGQIAKWERVPVPVGDSMGMLWAFDSLYVSGEGPEGRGIYRLKDTDGDDTLDTAPLWKAVPGGNGEHGAHALVLGPDGKSIYIVHGNSTPLIDGVDMTKSPYRNYAEDDLLPRVWDPVATFFDKIKAPYGHVLRTDENGTHWELMAGGFRNPYDIDFNADGELFTFDSDMEWDVGLPWYRPTRVLHVVPGGEYGFREGSAKWPAWYPDSLPAAVDIGLGSPTGVKFGTRSNFPERYRRAFFIMDWTFGRILAVHLRPQGASYTARSTAVPAVGPAGILPAEPTARASAGETPAGPTGWKPVLPSTYRPSGPEAGGDVEVFVSGKGLPVTDLEFGKDGAMYFTIGGRGTQAGLYRVSWTGEKNRILDPWDRGFGGADHARVERRAVEASKAPMFQKEPFDAYNHLLTGGRNLTFAARLVLEAKPTAEWVDRALAETENARALPALLALVRAGTKDDQPAIFKALAKFPFDSLSDELKLEKLRVIEVAFARHGRPSDEMVQTAIEKLGRQYPAKTFALNRELCQLLVYLGAPDVVEKTLPLIDGATDPAEAVWFALCLREAKTWTAAQRERYFAWFATAREFQGGNSFAKFVLRIRDQALEKVPPAERGALLALATKDLAPNKPVAPPVPVRGFIKAWTLDELVPELPKTSAGRNFARGKEIFSSTQCLQCHHFGREGGNVGPDLSAVANRFNRRDLLEAIIDPSKALSEQYASYLITTKKGETLMGQIVEDNNDYITLITDPLAGTKQDVSTPQVATREMSKVSLMPPGLINVLTADEILDLLAYIESGGSAPAPNFAAPPL
ncbi:MAG: Heme-binding protein [Chthoniobacter sp.]|nr:Heme-binding protein [Chthoniobacter sp.]